MVLHREVSSPWHYRLPQLMMLMTVLEMYPYWECSCVTRSRMLNRILRMQSDAQEVTIKIVVEARNVDGDGAIAVTKRSIYMYRPVTMGILLDSADFRRTYHRRGTESVCTYIFEWKNGKK